jgi:hypothetical protein
LAAATIFIAPVICRVEATEVMRVRISFKFAIMSVFDVRLMICIRLFPAILYGMRFLGRPCPAAASKAVPPVCGVPKARLLFPESPPPFSQKPACFLNLLLVLF